MVKISYDPIAGEIIASGHAGYAEEGKDIVCAAVSTLLFTLVARLAQSNIEHELQAEDGMFTLRVRGRNALVMFLIETIILGLRMLRDQYPEYVDFKEVYNGSDR